MAAKQCESRNKSGSHVSVKCEHPQTCGGDCMLCGEKNVHARRNLEIELKRILQCGLIAEEAA